MSTHSDDLEPGPAPQDVTGPAARPHTADTDITDQLTGLRYQTDHTYLRMAQWRAAARNSVIAALAERSLDDDGADELLRSWQLPPLPYLWDVRGSATLTYLHHCGDPVDARAAAGVLVPGAVAASLRITTTVSLLRVVNVAPAGERGWFRVTAKVGFTAQVTAVSAGTAHAVATAGLLAGTGAGTDAYQAELADITWAEAESTGRPPLHPDPLPYDTGALVPRLSMDPRTTAVALRVGQAALASLTANVPGLPRTRRIDVTTEVTLAVTADDGFDATAIADAFTEHTVLTGSGWRATGRGSVNYGDIPGDDLPHPGKHRFEVRAQRFCSVLLHDVGAHERAVQHAASFAAVDLASVVAPAAQVTALATVVEDRGASLRHDLDIDED